MTSWSASFKLFACFVVRPIAFLSGTCPWNGGFVTSDYSQLSFRGLLFGPVIVRCVRRSVLDLINLSHVRFDSHASRVIYAACSTQSYLIFSKFCFTVEKIVPQRFICGVSRVYFYNSLIVHMWGMFEQHWLIGKTFVTIS